MLVTRIRSFTIAACILLLTLAIVPKAGAATTFTVTLAAIDGSNATGQVAVTVENGHTTLVATVSGLTPHAVHSLWELLDSTAPPFITDPVLGLVVVSDDNLGTLAPVVFVTPAVADNAGFKAGTGLDPNGFVTDADGKATFRVKLNYEITQPEIAPIVLTPLTQTVKVEPVSGPGACHAAPNSSFSSLIDSAYARKFDTSSSTPSFQVLDGEHRAKLIRGTVASLVVVEHLDGLTHGHTPGVMVALTGCGDELGKLKGALP